MKIARRPTTIARTPRPSANAARMIAIPRIWPAASGLRPIAWADMPARMPMPMPGPKTPRAARPAPMCSIRDFLLFPERAARDPEPMGLCCALGGASVGRLELGPLRAFDVIQHLFREMPLLFVVTLDREDDEDQRQDAE